MRGTGRLSQVILFGVVLAAFPPLLPAQTAHDWLSSQQQFNGLVDSYQSDSSLIAYTYDQALAIVAFTAENDLVRARRILDRLVAIQRSDGSWVDAYSAANGSEASISRTSGNPIWVVNAINYYTLQTGDMTYVPAAQRCADWFLTLQELNPSSSRYGSISGGYDGGNRIQWTSTEHNQDAYAALKNLGLILNNPFYISRANLVYNWVTRRMWDPVGGRFYVGLLNSSAVNTGEFLDVQTWGVTALGPNGPIGEDYTRGLLYAYAKMRLTRTYNGQAIEGFDYNSVLVSPFGGVWFEGTEQMALALEVGGDSAGSDFYHSQAALGQSTNGGIIAAIGDGPLVWNTNYPRNSVAATSWFIFCSQSPKINPFRPTNPADLEPPAISNVGVANLTPNSAVIFWLTDEIGDSEVEFGTTPAYGRHAASGTESNSHAVLLSNLAPQTTYHFLVQSTDAWGNAGGIDGFTFTTPAPPPDVVPPDISSVGISTVTADSAIVFWFTDENSDSQVEFGTTTAYGSSTPLNPVQTNSHGVLIAGLQPNTTYHFRVRSRDMAGNLAVSVDHVLTTAPPPDIDPPSISSVGVTGITAGSAIVYWFTDENSDSQVEFGTTTAYDGVVSSSSMVRSHGLLMPNLAPETTYHFRVRSRDASGNTEFSGDDTFTTSAAAP
jgi:chitodextrinase